MAGAAQKFVVDRLSVPPTVAEMMSLRKNELFEVADYCGVRMRNASRFNKLAIAEHMVDDWKTFMVGFRKEHCSVRGRGKGRGKGLGAVRNLRVGWQLFLTQCKER